MRRVISVTRRHIDFLFSRERCHVIRTSPNIRKSAHEGAVMSDLERRFKDAIVGSWYANGRAKTVAHGADLAWEATKHLFGEGEWLLSPTDDDHTGEDV